jgi:hypothetical protein
MKGILGIRTQGVFKYVWTQNIHFSFHFLSLGLRERVLSSLFLGPPPSSLFMSSKHSKIMQLAAWQARNKWKKGFKHGLVKKLRIKNEGKARV